MCRSECQKQVQGFKGPQFKKFSTKEEAEEFIQQHIGNVVDKRKLDKTSISEDSSNGAKKPEKKDDKNKKDEGKSKDSLIL